MRFVRKRLTYANVMSSLAVFLVVAGGTAFAASQLGKESVGTRQLKKEAVSLAKINAAAKNSLKGATGPQGPTGPKGDKGERGPVGPSTGPAGGVLTGTYPDPGLAAGAVTAGNFKLSSTLTIDAPLVAAESCALEVISVPAATTTDSVIVTPSFLVAESKLAFFASNGASNGFIRLTWCNPTAAAINIGSTAYQLVLISK